MSLARWDPFRELQNLEYEMNRLFRRQLSGASRPEEALTASQFAPAVDVYEDDIRLSVKMDVPGIDTKVLLTIRGERKFEKEEKKGNFRRVEREYGSFSRSFTLPESADSDNISANFENGTLRVEIPKRPNSRAKQFKIAEESTGGRKAASVRSERDEGGSE